MRGLLTPVVPSRTPGPWHNLGTMRFLRATLIATCAAAAAFTVTSAQTPEKAAPVFTDGQAQIVPAFQDQTQWIRQTLWVETEFDSDKDGYRDRVFTDVTRPKQTDTEGL